MKNLFKKTFSYILCTMLFAAITLCYGCGKTNDTSAVSETPETSISAETETSVSEETSVEVSAETTEEVIDEVTTEEESSENGVVTREGCELGEGETQFTFVVITKDGNEETFTVNTKETTVGAALLNVNLIAGEESDWGLYVKNVNGVIADYDVDQTYWAFYIDGEYAMTGVDSTEVTAGSTYTFKVE